MPDSQTTAEYELRTLKVSEIAIGRDNPRRIDATSGDIRELANSIAASGVIEPVHVRRVGNQRHELIAGERRMVAAKIAGCEEIPVIDHGAIGDDEAFEITFLENFGRKDLTVMEESLAVKMCMIKFGSSEKVAERLGKSIRWVEQRANIEKGLSAEWKKAIAVGLPFTVWPASHVALIARLPANIQDECLNDFQYEQEVPTRNELEARLASQVRLLDKAPWDMDAKGLNGKTPACGKCPKCSRVQPGLWDDPATSDADSKKYDRCLDVDCWDKKLVGYLKGRLKELKSQYGQVICLASKFPEMAYTLKETFGDFRLASEFSVVKKQADGRTAALIVYGTGIGEVRWVKDKATAGTSTASTGGSSRGGAGTPGAKPTPKTLKERRKELGSKRWFEVLREMFTVVTATKADDITVEERTLFVTTAATVFASSVGHTYVTNHCFTELKDRFAERLAGDDEPQLAADRELWEEVRTRIGEGLLYNGPITQVPKDKIAGAKIIAGYLGIDINAMFDKQKEAIAEPKSWSNLKTDGTPKAAKKKSSRKEAQKSQKK